MIVKIVSVEADEVLIQRVAEDLEKKFPFFEFEVSKEHIDVEKAYDVSRGQFVASKIVRMAAGNGFKVVVTSVDIYEDSLNFVFGLAIPVLRTAVVSYFRLIGENLFERLEKEIVHELGHLFGLEHCKNDCVMKFSNSVFEVDLKPLKFCERCYRSLRVFLKHFS